MGAKSKKSEGGNSVTSVALITTIGTVTVALITGLFAFPPFIARFQKIPTFTPTVAPVISPTFATDAPFGPVVLQPITDTPEISSATPVATDILPTVITNSSLPLGMNVQLSADKTTGKRPLTIHFDARGSFLRAPNGETYPCRGGPCNYTWEVYKDGQRIGKPAKNSTGTFQYTFGQRGICIVTVYICRGLQNSDCMGSGIPIEVK